MSYPTAGSSDSEVQRLREELRGLREEFRHLVIRVDRQADQIDRLTHELGTFELVEPSSTSAGAEPASSEPSPQQGAKAYTWEFREEVAREIGRFLRRCLSGESRGNSGRDRLKGLQSRYYLVVRDIEGKCYDPVLVLGRFSRVKDLCYRDGSWGDSIFIGVPSQAEASLAASAAGLRWPAAIQ